MDLRSLVDTLDVPDTRVADAAWDRARRRQLQHRGWALAGVGGLVVAAVVGIGIWARPSVTPSPAPAPATASPPAPTTPGDGHLPVAVVRPRWSELGSTPSLVPPADPPGLSIDPVAHAALVLGDPDDQSAAYVLGDDGVWRTLDVPGLQPTTDGTYTSSVVRPTGVDPTGTRLAVPQPDELVVVDLTTGRAQRYQVRGPNHEVLWLDRSHVLVASETGELRHVVDLDSGDVSSTDVQLGTRVDPEAGTLTWPRVTRSGYEWNGTAGVSVVNNAGALQETSPLIRGGRAVVVSGSGEDRGEPYPPRVLLTATGVAAVDLASGDPVGFLVTSPAGAPTRSTLLGWRDDDPLLALDSPSTPGGVVVVVWEVDAGTLASIATLPSYDISWGVGL